MPAPETLQAFNLALRAGLVTLLLFAAAMMVRDHARSRVARLAAVFALGVAAHAVQTMPGFAAAPAWWHAPLLALSAGNTLVFWLFSRALFDDAFRTRAWHGAVWSVLASAALLNCLLLGPGEATLATAIGLGITLATVCFALLAVAQSLSTWRSDLVEGRRRLRVFIVGAGATYTVVNVATRLLLNGGAPLDQANAGASLLDGLALAVIAAVVVWHLVGSSASALFEQQVELAFEPEAAPAPLDTAPNDPVDTRLIAALERLMSTERAYRQDGLTIGALATQLGVPEYKLRRAINQGLGHRNFNAFLNRYRIDEVKAALADPAQAPVPVLTIAMDAGFQSLGPFNRAFKAATGLTPTEFRRECLA